MKKISIYSIIVGIICLMLYITILESPFLVIGFVLIGIGVLFNCIDTSMPQCPGCSSRKSKFVFKQLIEKRSTTIKIKVEDKIYDNTLSGMKKGLPVKTIERTEYVPGTEWVYTVTYECLNCGKKFARIETETTRN